MYINLLYSPIFYHLETIKAIFAHYKSCSFIKYRSVCCGKPTIAIISMQECYDNDKIEPHNHNKYLLLYKEAEILALSLGRF